MEHSTNQEVSAEETEVATLGFCIAALCTAIVEHYPELRTATQGVLMETKKAAEDLSIPEMRARFVHILADCVGQLTCEDLMDSPAGLEALGYLEEASGGDVTRFNPEE